MKVKVSEATPIQLNWMVAEAKGIEVVYHDDGITRCVMRKGDRGQYAGRFDPITNWSQGGPILEREDIAIGHANSGEHENNRFNASKIGIHPWAVIASGPTKLIAAMRCVVMSELGDEVEVPEELT